MKIYGTTHTHHLFTSYCRGRYTYQHFVENKTFIFQHQVIHYFLQHQSQLMFNWEGSTQTFEWQQQLTKIVTFQYRGTSNYQQKWFPSSLYLIWSWQKSTMYQSCLMYFSKKQTKFLKFLNKYKTHKFQEWFVKKILKYKQQEFLNKSFSKSMYHLYRQSYELELHKLKTQLSIPLQSTFTGTTSTGTILHK